MRVILPPPSPLEPHQLRCTTLLLSVDPFLRCRFNADPGVAYTSAYEIDAPIASAGIGIVNAALLEAERVFQHLVFDAVCTK